MGKISINLFSLLSFTTIHIHLIKKILSCGENIYLFVGKTSIYLSKNIYFVGAIALVTHNVDPPLVAGGTGSSVCL